MLLLERGREVERRVARNDILPHGRGPDRPYAWRVFGGAEDLF